MRDFVYQTNDHECGFSCLKMLLARLYHDERFLFLPTINKEKPTYTLYEIKEIGKKYGLALAGYLHRSEPEIIHEKTPFIIVKKLANGGRHALLVKKITRTFAYIYDPALGKKIMLTKKLIEEQINEGIETLIVESFHPVSLDFELPKLLSKKEEISLVLIEAVSILCYFFSAMFINPDSNIVYPIALIVGGIIMAIICRVYTYSIMRKFDENYIGFTYHSDPIIRRDNYELMHTTKSGLFLTISNIIINLMSALAVNTILILKNNYSVFILLTSLVIVIIDYIYITPVIKKNAYEVERLENHLLDTKDIEISEYENSYQEIKEKTYKVARRFDLKKIGSYFILLMVTFFMSGILNQANIEFILYHFAMCLFTYTCLNEVAKSLDKYKDNLINQTKFYDLIIKNKK